VPEKSETPQLMLYQELTIKRLLQAMPQENCGTAANINHGRNNATKAKVKLPPDFGVLRGINKKRPNRQISN
jgi:hypothetical protein